MNILPLVFTILLILGIFTHTQFEHFKRFGAVKKEYADYITDRERSAFNVRQINLYDNFRSQTGTGSTKPKPPPRISDKGINLALVLGLDGNGSIEQQQHQFLFKEIMRLLYQNTIYYPEMEQNRSQFLDEMLNRLILAVEAKGKLNSVGELEKLDLKDEELQNVYYAIMKGSNQINQPTPISEEDLHDDDEVIEEEVVNNLSLKQFVHLKSFKKVHVYLARRKMLEAIFDPNTAGEIIAKRKELFKRQRKGENNEVLSQQFKDQFNKMKKDEIKEEILDFSVTGTDPGQYD